MASNIILKDSHLYYNASNVTLISIRNLSRISCRQPTQGCRSCMCMETHSRHIHVRTDTPAHEWKATQSLDWRASFAPIGMRFSLNGSPLTFLQ